MEASVALWWVAWIGLLVADMWRGRRRLTPYLLLVGGSDLAVLLLGWVEVDAALLGRVDGALRILQPAVLGWIGSRHYPASMVARAAPVVVLVATPLALSGSFEMYTWLLGAAWIGTSLTLILAAFQQANLGLRVPLGTDIALTVIAALELISYAVVLGDKLGSGDAITLAWDEVNYPGAFAMGAGAVAHVVRWRCVVRRLG